MGKKLRNYLFHCVETVLNYFSVAEVCCLCCSIDRWWWRGLMWEGPWLEEKSIRAWLSSEISWGMLQQRPVRLSASFSPGNASLGKLCLGLQGFPCSWVWRLGQCGAGRGKAGGAHQHWGVQCGAGRNHSRQGQSPRQAGGWEGIP